MANKIILRRDTATNWSNADPILSNGEIGLETDTQRFKIGNGVQPWSERSYYANAQSIADEYAGVLMAAVAEANQAITDATAQTALAAAEAAEAEAHKEQAGVYAQTAQFHANDAANTAAGMATTTDALMEDIVSNPASATRTELDLHYKSTSAAAEEYRGIVSRGSSSLWPLGWTDINSGSGVSFTHISDVPDWLEITNDSGLVLAFDNDIIGTENLKAYTVNVQMVLEGYTNSTDMPDNSIWGFGWDLSNGPFTSQPQYVKLYTVNAAQRVAAMEDYFPKYVVETTLVLTGGLKYLRLFGYSGYAGGTNRQWNITISAVRHV